MSLDPSVQVRFAEAQAGLQEAFAFHQRGQLAEAEGRYRDVLLLVPEHPDVLHMLGVLEAQKGNPGGAVELLRRVIAVSPANPAVHNNYGNALMDLDRPDEALASYDRALTLKPDYVQALNHRGGALRRLKRYEEALGSYDRALAISPADVEVLNNRGNALRDLGKPEEALASYDRALSLRPDHVQILSNKGNALKELGRFDESLATYGRALVLHPGCVEALYNRANTLRELQRYEEALADYERALAVKPDYAEALHNRGATLQDLNRPEEALASHERAVALRPENANFHTSRAHVLSVLRREPEAIAAYRQALALGGDPTLLHYYLAALGAEPAPPTPPRSYVETLFDQYAERFDDALRQLKYEIPKLLFDTVIAVNPGAGRDIADLGCGTGMCGVYFKPIAKSLVGVDLAQAMIEKSRARGVYDRLVRADLREFLRAHPHAFDLVVTADVFIYVGALEEVFAATREALRSGGQLAFSVESEGGDGFVLRSSRRYAHSLPYLRRLAAANGFVERAVVPVTVRLAEGKGIPGYNLVFELIT